MHTKRSCICRSDTISYERLASTIAKKEEPRDEDVVEWFRADKKRYKTEEEFFATSEAEAVQSFARYLKKKR